MKILVVEDEPGPREGLVRLLEASNPDWEVLPPCMSGVEGLRSVQVYRPDLVITDIRMADGDGLELIRSLRDTETPPVVIVVSGFSDFEYARKCIEFGVRDYLVKPVTPSAILGAVISVEAEHVADRDLVDALNQGQGLEGRGLLLLVKTKSGSSPQRRLVLKREVRNLTGNPNGSLYAEVDNGVALFVWVRNCGPIATASTRDYASHLSTVLRDTTVVSAAYCDGRNIAECAAQLRTMSLDALLGDLGRHLILRGSQIDAIDLPYSLVSERNILSAIASSGEPTFVQLLGSWFEEVYRPGFRPESVLQATKRMCVALQNRLKDLDTSRFMSLVKFDPIGRLDSCLDRRSVGELLNEIASVVTATKSVAATGTNNSRIHEVLAMIESRYANPPSLSECAEIVGVSAEHLSRLFRDETGSGFSRYVTTRRIKAAQSLMTDRVLTIDAIAKKLGFGSTKYFFAVFRKETGLTPSEYRDRLR